MFRTPSSNSFGKFAYADIVRATGCWMVGNPVPRGRPHQRGAGVGRVRVLGIVGGRTAKIIHVEVMMLWRGVNDLVILVQGCDLLRCFHVLHPATWLGDKPSSSVAIGGVESGGESSDATAAGATGGGCARQGGGWGRLVGGGAAVGEPWGARAAAFLGVEQCRELPQPTSQPKLAVPILAGKKI